MEPADMKKELRVLMLEDTPADAELAERELRKAGIVFTSLRVETRDAFVRAFEEFHPDIVLSDYKLPDFDGMTALQMARRDHPQVPVIMVTGALSDIEAVELIHAGAKDYILKDRLARLAPAVQRALSAEQGIRARKAAEEKFRKISESAQDAIIMMADKRISFWNAAAERIFGYTAAEAMGQELHLLLAPASAHAAFAQGNTHFLKSGEGPVIGKLLELTALRKGGEEFPVELTISAAQLNGQWHAISIVRDITERKRAEEALHESRRMLERIFDSTHFCVAYLDRDFNFIRVNRAYAESCGFPPEYFPGKNHFHLYPQAENEAIFRRVVQTGEPFTISAKPFEYPDHPEWGVSYWDWTLHPLKAPNGSVDALLFVLLDVTGRKRAEAELLSLNRTLKALSTGNRALVHSENEKSLLENMCSATNEAGFVLAWVGYAMQDEKKSILPMAVSGEGKSYIEALNLTWDDVPLGRGPSGAAIRTGQTQISNDIKNDPRMEPWLEMSTKYGYASSIALPLKENGRVFGTLTIYAVETNAFGTDQVALLEEMAEDLAFGLNALRIRQERDHSLEQDRQHILQLQDSLEDSVRAIASIVEMRDPYTAGHQVRVAGLAAAIARQMGLPEERVHVIYLAGVVHDLGKIRIPAEILSKPGKITDIEFSLIKTHPQAGYDILKDIDFSWPIAQIVLQHHERLDGSGYPQGLKGDAILLEARILAVADVVEAIYSHRPYRPGLGIEAALDEITRARGTRYDSQAVDACVALFRERGYSLAV